MLQALIVKRKTHVFSQELPLPSYFPLNTQTTFFSGVGGKSKTAAIIWIETRGTEK